MTSFIIHGLQGWFAGLVYKSSRGKKITGLLLSSLVMVVGYFLASCIMYDWPAALSSLPGNTIQTLVGVVVGWIIADRLRKILPENIKENLEID